MQLHILKTKEEKLRTRVLYEQVFPEDSRAFLDFYYEDRCRDNRIAVLEEQGEILSMAHLNPYRMRILGQETEVCYIYAVATREDCRHRGYMRQVLALSFRELTEEGIPFCFLIPADPAIYLPFGFEKLCDFSRTQPSPAEREHYEVYCIEDEDYRRRAAREQALAAEQSSDGLPADAIVMGRVLNRQRLQALAGGRERSDTELLSWLRERRILITEDI